MTSQEDIDRLVSLIQVLKNKDLISICVLNRLAKSGNKAELQKRIINLIDAAVQDPNPQKILDIQATILNYGPSNYRRTSSIPSSPSYLPSGMSSPYNGHGNGVNGGIGDGSHGGSGYGSDPNQRLARNSMFGLQFRPSPFYEVDSQLGTVRSCEAMTQHRNNISVLFRASTYPQLQKCLTDTALRVMIFCSAANTGVQDVTFPYQCEIKVNGGEVKANLRGLKNKPGSTRPVDITDLLRLKPPTYSNTVDFTYALTSKTFYIVLFLCRTSSPTSLASMVEKKARITKTSVIREVTKQAQDPDIVATSQVLSLKCPLTYMRLSMPIRATTCRHVQCFDATSYLQLQEQGPQWLCPICSKPAPFESLAVDEYVRDILIHTSGEQDQVTIEPDGTWHTEKPRPGGTPTTPRTGQTSFVEDEDELIIPDSVQSSDVGLSGTSPAQLGAASSLAGGTPNLARTLPITPSHSTSKKRKPEVIDLTLSDDDDDTEERPVKRQATAAPMTLFTQSSLSSL